jgi:hypothetical protein
MRLILATSLIALAAACGGAPEQNRAAEPIANVTAGNQVAALPEGQRNAVLIRAILDAGQECQHVNSSTPGGTYRGMPVWQATCRGGGHWTIVVADDGTAQILNADQARLVTDAPANSTGR